MAKKNDALKSRIARVVLEAAEPHLPGWIETLGVLGSPAQKGDKNPVPPQTQVQAARAGVDFVTKFIGEAGTHEAGTNLLAELLAAEAKAVEEDNTEDTT